jgi:hypothetical protein
VGKDVVVPEKAEIENQEENSPVAFGSAIGESFEDLAQESITLPGHDLVKDDELDALVGVDMIITRVSFREGIPRTPDNMWLKANPKNTIGAYVSLELSTNPELVISNVNRARVASKLSPIQSLDHLEFDPGSHFVINDGSTGIYRQIVAFLAMTQYVDIPEGPTEGASGQTICDTIPDEWPNIHVGEIRFAPTGFATYTANVRLRCRRGLRVSEYQSQWNPDSKTRYLA